MGYIKKIYKDKLDPVKTNWLNILPPIEGKKLLKYGSANYHTIEALVRSECESVTCIGPCKLDQYNSSSLRFVESVNHFTDEKFDIGVIDEPSFFKNSQFAIKKIVNTFYNRLNEKGIILIGIPPGMPVVKYRLVVKRILINIGFSICDSYLCDPSFDEPFSIYPISRWPKFVEKEIFKNSYTFSSIKLLIKNTIKFLLFKVSQGQSPLMGYILIAAKNENERLSEDIADILVSQNAIEQDTDNPICTIWTGKPYTCKNVGLIYHGKDEHLIAISKKANYSYYNDSAIMNEYENLVKLNTHVEFFRQNNIVLPKPIYCKKKAAGIISIESGIRGKALSGISINNHKNIEMYKKCLSELVAIQIKFQKYLSANLIEELPQVSFGYFKNSLHIDCYYFDDISRLSKYKQYVQHGDYTDVNLYYNRELEQWGIIDWEWLAAGFPPLFDLFHLFFSARFRRSVNNREELLEHYFNSFKETFFDINWFSEYLQILIFKYYKIFEIPKKNIFNFFLDFLLFIYNKYRLAYRSPAYEELQKQCLYYAINNRDKFIVY